MPTTPTPSRAANLTESMVDEVKRLIYSGEVKPGERLNEAALALRMGTSRGPIREAMKELAGQGLVTVDAIGHARSHEDREHEPTPTF